MMSGDVISAAESYVNQNGDVLSRARVAALIRKATPAPEALAAWRKGWQVDGGWASAGAVGAPSGETRGRSNLIATARALRYARELELGVRAEVRLALYWLIRQQRTEGFFVDEYPVVSNALDAKRLGGALADADERINVWATATALHALDEWIPAVPPFADARQRAYDWLTGCVSAWNTQHSRSIWLTAGASIRRAGPDNPFALKLLALLALRLGETDMKLTPRDLADLAATIAEAGLSASVSPVNGAMTMLARMRRDDGAFADPLGREDTVESTVAAVRAYLVTGKSFTRV